jgi:hypothetical protein
LSEDSSSATWLGCGNRSLGQKLGLWARNQAEHCEKYVIQDTDGRFILDFLGPPFHAECSGIIDKKTVSAAYKFALDQYESAASASDEKLRARYFRLIRYFEARKTLWGI